ncbi:uncharacterized protein ATNIH1004_005301 [Aspergillus tanneri]|uniref:Neuraminidase-like domain-containing protein n=1 Tax=Aspergillus tanneri TaxID=1220188 RepID=A0A5M9MVP0_9EURO|nr:uncharacterized protein ATNIH1004_005301 [Aspergillus tanneri]KAA8649400.1 hypothetical protein ATNIH1004_005301 [Aspergillus tanneri]
MGRGIKMYWQPWTKIDVEVPVHEVGADDNTLPKSESHLIPALYRECAFLFFTQITLKTAPNGATKDKAINDISNENQTPHGVKVLANVRSAQSTDFLFRGHASGEGCLVETENLPDVSRSNSGSGLRQAPRSLLLIKQGGGAFAIAKHVPAPSTSIFVIDVERWINAGEGQQPRYLNYPLGGVLVVSLVLSQNI